MQKQITQFKAIVKDIECTFHFDQNCPIAVAKEALLQCLKWVGQIEDAVKAQSQAQEETNKPEEPKQEPVETQEEAVNDQ
jgi:hypothetical protein